MAMEDGMSLDGWCCTGEVADASANHMVGNEVANTMNQPIHISYLYPSSAAAVTQIGQRIR
jgi:hypothetical protein